MIVVSCVVEGDGEVLAVPALVQRIARTERPGETILTPPPARLPRSRIAIDGELERYVELAANRVDQKGGVLLVFDADDDCPATLAPSLLNRAVASRGDVAIGLVLAHKEWEAWFLASAESIAGRRDLPDDLAPPVDPEAIRNAKGWLSDRMPSGRRYRETVDQPALTRSFDLDLARERSPSFEKCYREVTRLLHSEQLA